MYRMLTCPYVESYKGKKGSPIFQEPWIIAIEKSIETLILVSISDMKTSQYWKAFGSMIDKSKEKIPKQC